MFTKFLSNLLMSVGSVVIPFPCLSFLLVICIFYLFSLLCLARDLLIVLMLFKEQAFGFFDFLYCFLIPFSLSSALIFIIFFCLCWIYIILFFSLVSKDGSLILDLSFFIIKTFKAIQSPLSTAFATSHAFGKLYFYFKLLKTVRIFFSLTYMLFGSMYLVS